MAKKRHHYIPQFLLRRFASRTGRSCKWVWQFRDGDSPKEIVTKDAAVSRFFHGTDGIGLEDGLARLESDHARVLRALDSGADPETFSESLRTLAWFLAVRTRAFRKQLTQVVSCGMQNLAASGSQATQAFERELQSNFPKHLQVYLETLPQDQRSWLAVLLQDESVYAAFHAHVYASLAHVPEWVHRMCEDIASDALNTVESGHLRALNQLAARALPPDEFRVPRWSLLHCQHHGVVLGDSVVVAEGPEGAWGVLKQSSTDFRSIYIPVSPELVVVGHHGSGSKFLLPDELNVESVRLSWDTFFAARNSEYEIALAARIGEAGPVLPEEDIRLMVEESWNSLGRGGPAETS